MTPRNKKIQRDYSDEPIFSIGTVARMLNLHQQTIREYEKEGLIRPKRTPGGTRMYSERDVERLRFIVTLTQDMGVNLAGVELLLKMREDMDELVRLTQFILSQVDDSLRARIKSFLRGEKEGLLRVSRVGTGLVPRRKIEIDFGDEK